MTERAVGTDAGVWTLPNLLSAIRLAGVPVFLWLVLGPEADGWALGLLVLAALATLYHLGVPWRTPWHRDLPGAVLAMAGWFAASGGLRAYLALAGQDDQVYQRLGTPIAVVLWLYVSAVALLLGAGDPQALACTCARGVSGARTSLPRRGRGMVAAIATPSRAAAAPMTKQAWNAPSLGTIATRSPTPRDTVLLVRTVPISAEASVVPSERARAFTPTAEPASWAGLASSTRDGIAA